MSGRGDDRIYGVQIGAQYSQGGVLGGVTTERKPWECPVCHRGVRGDRDSCDHGGAGALRGAIGPAT